MQAWRNGMQLSGSTVIRPAHSSHVLLSSYSISNNNSLRDRSALLGASSQNPYSYANSGRSSPYLAHAQPHSNRSADELESQNDEHLEGLSAKVKLLKDVR